MSTGVSQSHYDPTPNSPCCLPSAEVNIETCVDDIIELRHCTIKAEHESGVSHTLSLQEAIDAVSSPDCGAISTFCGTVRNYSFVGCPPRRRCVVKLIYEAYEPMALGECRRICQQLRATHDQIHRIAIYHRLGEASVGDVCVIVAVSSSHRAQSLGAVAQAIDAVKARVPIWKRELYVDGQSSWKHNSECFWTAQSEAVTSGACRTISTRQQ